MAYRVTNKGNDVITVYDKRGTKSEISINLLPSQSCITQDKIEPMSSLSVEEIPEEKPEKHGKKNVW